jgi:hypothetical protein
MSRSGTAGRVPSWRRRCLSHRLGWLLGASLVCVGALAGAFGTIAWLSAFCAPTLPRMLLGMVSLGLLPVLGGGAMLWAGLSVLESHAAIRRVREMPEARFVEAARPGGSARAIADRLAVVDEREVIRRLDDLVVRGVLALDITDEGELFYRPANVA